MLSLTNAQYEQIRQAQAVIDKVYENTDIGVATKLLNEDRVTLMACEVMLHYSDMRSAIGGYVEGRGDTWLKSASVSYKLLKLYIRLFVGAKIRQRMDADSKLF